MPKEKQLIHARINSPILVRKTLLESAILTTDILKSYQRLKKIRTEKRHYRAQLKQNLHEIKQLLEKLELEELPRPPSIPKQEKIEQEKLLESESSELDTELRKLQEKLKSL